MHAGSSPSPTRSEHSVHLKTFFVFVIELGNVERAAGDAISAADAVLLLEIDDAVGVLHDGAVGGAGAQAAGIGAVHALILAHQPHQRAVFALMLVELDQVPVIPPRLRHRLVGVVETLSPKRHIVPLHARHFARLAADAGRGVDQLADRVFGAACLRRERCPRGRRSFELAVWLGSCALLGLLDLHQESLELRRVRVGIDRPSATTGSTSVFRRLALILGDAAEAPVNGNADLVGLLAVDHHRLDAPRDHRLAM